MTALNGWENFYVIVGSSAGALIGLQFVVMTLVADIPLARGAAQTSSAFTTPSVIHFGVVLLISAIASMPWHQMVGVSVVWGLVGISGVLYSLVIARRLRRQTIYRPVFEDWLFHLLLPIAAYLMLAVAAYTVHVDDRRSMFLVGAAVLLLLFVGIHNAWDLVTYHVFVRKREKAEADEEESPE